VGVSYIEIAISYTEEKTDSENKTLHTLRALFFIKLLHRQYAARGINNHAIKLIEETQ
jgi:hypothetical protein